MKIVETFQRDAIRGFKFGSWPFGRPHMFVHTYFVDGLLIDTGHPNMRKEILKTIGDLPVDKMYITHHHEDHAGNIDAFQQHFKVPCFASEACVQIMKKPPAVSFAQWLTWGSNTASHSLTVKEQKIETERFSFTIIPVPGHARDMVCLHEPNQGWLFSADLFVNEYIKYFMRTERMLEQIDSLKKILTLDFQYLLCSHNPQFTKVKDKLRAKLQFLEDFFGRVQDLYKEGNNVKAILEKMQLKENWSLLFLSTGGLSTRNMIKSVIRDLEEKNQVKTIKN